VPKLWRTSEGFNRKPRLLFRKSEENFTTDGGHRCFSPEETLKKYQHHISPLTGVVRGLEKVSPDWNSLAHTYIVRHHFASMFDDLNSLRQNIGGRSVGKGQTDIQARISGLCEAIERYSGVFQETKLGTKALSKTGGQSYSSKFLYEFQPRTIQKTSGMEC
jgi:ribosomal protein S12 methylthiotransferase accessory factor